MRNRYVRAPLGRLAAAAAGSVAVVALACGGGAARPQTACLEIEASDRLNLFDGQPHVVTLYLFPLSSSADFEQTPIEDLLDGASPRGVEGAPVHVTVAPGEQDRSVEERFPPQTAQLGVVADYYRAPGDPEGTRRQVVPVGCGLFGTPKLALGARDVFVD